MINNNELHLPTPLAASPAPLLACQSLRKRLQPEVAARRRGVSLRKTSFVQMVSWRRHQVAAYPELGLDWTGQQQAITLK